MTTLKTSSCCSVPVSFRQLQGFLCSLWLCCSWVAQGQTTPVCGSVLEHKEYAHYKRQVQQESKSIQGLGRQLVTLKLQPHIIRRSNGTGGISINDVYTSVEQLNQAFEQVGFYFDVCSPNTIRNDDYYNEIVLSTNPNSREYQMAIPSRVEDAINVYFVPNGVQSSGSPSQTNWSSFPYFEQKYNKNWTVMSNAFATDGETLAHEIGHYFNLLHTHHDSIGEGPFDGTGIPPENVTRDPSDPCYNCETAGDLLCDTEADPEISMLTDSFCQYIGTDTSACGEFYQPNTSNVMSYAIIQRTSIGCRTYFSPGQIHRMRVALEVYRTNLANNCFGCPSHHNVAFDVLNGQVQLISASNQITATNTVFSGGTAVYNAGNEIVLSPDFEVQLGASFDGFIEDCSTPAALPPAPSTTSSQTVPNKTGISMALAPNPAREQVDISFVLPSSQAFVHIRVVNAQGQEVQQTLLQEALSEGTYQVRITTQELPAGLYFIQLSTNQESITQNLVLIGN